LSYKTCKQCGKSWPDRGGFLSDPQVFLSGCQMEIEQPPASCFLFDHRAPGCGTTIAIRVSEFDELYDGPRHKVKWGLSAKCPGMCHDPVNLEPCDKECACAYVRQILQTVRGLVAAGGGRAGS